jgi:ferredoxin/flavodoxin
MKIEAVRLACFSPTHTTRTVLEAIGRGTGINAVAVTDVTPPRPPDWPDVAADELLVIGAPVYAGRLPATAVERFRGLKGSGGPAVVVAVYGNREFEDALVELEDIVKAAGFRTVAGAAFIGEHSYHTGATPIAPGRPDRADIARAEAFGRDLRRLLDGISGDDIVTVDLPGNRPYRDRVNHGTVTPVTDAVTCTRCGECVTVCPVAAIPDDDPTTTDGGTCITCAACIKVCPVEARSLQDAEMLRRLQWLLKITRERKEPQTWLGEV